MPVFDNDVVGAEVVEDSELALLRAQWCILVVIARALTSDLLVLFASFLVSGVSYCLLHLLRVSTTLSTSVDGHLSTRKNDSDAVRYVCKFSQARDYVRGRSWL